MSRGEGPARTAGHERHVDSLGKWLWHGGEAHSISLGSGSGSAGSGAASWKSTGTDTLRLWPFFLQGWRLA